MRRLTILRITAFPTRAPTVMPASERRGSPTGTLYRRRVGQERSLPRRRRAAKPARRRLAKLRIRRLGGGALSCAAARARGGRSCSASAQGIRARVCGAGYGADMSASWPGALYRASARSVKVRYGLSTPVDKLVETVASHGLAAATQSLVVSCFFGNLKGAESTAI
jgi:hypothetical protein